MYYVSKTYLKRDASPNKNVDHHLVYDLFFFIIFFLYCCDIFSALHNVCFVLQSYPHFQGKKGHMNASDILILGYNTSCVPSPRALCSRLWTNFNSCLG